MNPLAKAILIDAAKVAVLFMVALALSTGAVPFLWVA